MTEIHTKFIKHVRYKVFLYLLSVVLVFIVISRMINSFFLCAALSVLLVYVGARIVQSMPTKKKRLLGKVFLGRSTLIKSSPMFDDELKKLAWDKGVGYIGDVCHPMWTAVSSDGLMLFYLCAARKGFFLVPWKECKNICFPLEDLHARGSKCARLYFDGVDEDVLVPWNKEFNQLVMKKESGVSGELLIQAGTGNRNNPRQ